MQNKPLTLWPLVTFRETFQGISICRYHPDYVYQSLVVPIGQKVVRIRAESASQIYLSAT